MMIEWGADDALPFDLCLSASYDGIHTVETSVALGNIVLADHGRTIEDEELPGIPRAGRYYPHLRRKGLTFGEPFHRGRAAIWSANELLSQEPRRAMPSLALRELDPALVPGDERSLLPLEKHRGFTYPVKHWAVRSSLAGSGAFERNYAVEIEDDGRAYLRFGFLGMGWRPEAVGAPFVATYRIGEGSAGNVGRDTIVCIVSDDKPITGVRNPLPARGGTDPTSTEEARRHAPQAFRELAFCVTEADYKQAAERHPQVARAIAQLRWTGTMRTAFIYVQRRGDRPMDEGFRRELAAFMERFRLAGCDLEIRGARFVPLEIELAVHLQPYHQASVVVAALDEAFSDRRLSDERVGFFHAARWTFGQSVHQSQVIARAMAVPGVAHVKVNKFRRRGADHDDDPIPIGTLEIVRLHNDPDDPVWGSIGFKLG
jgi:predicted phage baseplate assembly protein